jgi:hypothetical protein
LEQTAAEPAARIASVVQEVARNSGSVLANAALALNLKSGREQDELLGVLKNMPRCDLGNLKFEVGPNRVASVLGRRWAIRRAERRIRSQAGNEIALQGWVRNTFTELQEQFDSYAGAYRAHLDRLTANQGEGEDEQALRDDLASLAAVPEEASKR